MFTVEESQLSTRTGMSIVQRVLQGHLKLLYSCLNPTSPPEVIKSTLRLLTAMVTQGPSAAREVQRSFDFILKSLSSLPNKRDRKVCYYKFQLDLETVDEEPLCPYATTISYLFYLLIFFKFTIAVLGKILFNN